MGSAPAILSSMTVTAAGPCDGTTGRGSILITHDADAADVLRQLTVIVDGHQESPVLEPGSNRTVVDGIACDGTARTVLVVAVARDGSAPTRAFAVMLPR